MEPKVPAVPTVQLDNDRVIVTEWRFPRNGETGWHRHGFDYIVVPLTSGQLLLENGDGDRIVELTAGQSYSREIGVEHNVVNISPHEFKFIEIELKSGS